MIKDNGFENTSGNGELEDELLEALNKKGLLPTDEENAADGETAGPGEDAEDSAQPEEESLEEFLSEDAAEEETPEQDGKAKGQKAEKIQMDSRRFRYGSMATAITAVVAVLVVVLNVVVSLLADGSPSISI